MDLIDGVTVQEFRPRDAAQAWDVMRDVADAVKFLHDNEIVHFDLHAKNVMIERATGRAKIIDFGMVCEKGYLCMMPIVGLKGPGIVGLYPPEAYAPMPGPFETYKSFDVWMLYVRVFGRIARKLPHVLLTMLEDDTLRAMAFSDPAKRPTIDQVIAALRGKS